MKFFKIFESDLFDYYVNNEVKNFNLLNDIIEKKIEIKKNYILENKNEFFRDN